MNSIFNDKYFYPDLLRVIDISMIVASIVLTCFIFYVYVKRVKANHQIPARNRRFFTIAFFCLGQSLHGVLAVSGTLLRLDTELTYRAPSLFFVYLIILIAQYDLLSYELHKLFINRDKVNVK